MKINFAELDGLIWDMDGVLVDVTRSYREVIRRTSSKFLKRNVCEEEVNTIKNIVGFNNDWDTTYALVKNIKDPNLVDKNSIEYLKIKSVFQKFYLGTEKSPGAINEEKLLISKQELEKLLAKFKIMGIVTGRPRLEAEFILEKYDLKNLFDELICMEDVKNDKPNPEGILKAINNLGLRNTIYIGDSPSDIEASKKARIPCIYISENKGGDLNLKNSSKLLEILL